VPSRRAMGGKGPSAMKGLAQVDSNGEELKSDNPPTPPSLRCECKEQQEKTL